MHDDDDVVEWVAQVVIARLECWLVEHVRGSLVGMLVLDADWIEQLYVDPDSTGNGIGSELITVAKRQQPEGLPLLDVRVERGRPALLPPARVP